ncbi:hypothetical protein SPHINGO391_380001 [Sphingomonas aurantiaca]|uniref:Uncharacterized protein n=1 Tax=Sphingomonas aurantiaca TaxID=185949 RepID=A0A5E7YGG7_9SPHN|nr:hypothetical protein SPHINGO391_380001 [Sphingomonas aurantiaca]
MQEAWSIWFFATAPEAGEALRCGDTPLRPPHTPVKHFLAYLWQFSPPTRSAPPTHPHGRQPSAC